MALCPTRPSAACPYGTQGRFYGPCGIQGQVNLALYATRAKPIPDNGWRAASRTARMCVHLSVQTHAQAVKPAISKKNCPPG